MEQSQNTSQAANGISDKARFPLLRRLSITSLVSMLITAAILTFLYRQDQFNEHKDIAAQENEKTAMHLSHLLGDQINAIIAASENLDAQTMRTSPSIDEFSAALETVREHHVLKLEIYNLAGVIVYSSDRSEIGGASDNEAWLVKALLGGTVHHMKFHDTFHDLSGELYNRYIANTYMPLTHAGNSIGAIEIYADATSIIERIFYKTITIALVVLGAFAALYATLFFSVFRTDRAVAAWQKAINDNAQKLMESEKQFHTLAEAMPQIVWITRPDGWIIYFNQQWADYTGMTLEESYGHGWNAPFHPDDQQRAWDAWQYAIQNDSTFNLESRLRRADGVYRWWLVRGVALHDASGRITNWFGTCTDIEDMKQAELRDKALVRRNEVLMQSTNEGIHILDEHGKIIEANEAFCRRLGYTQAEVLQLSVFDFDAKLSADEVKENLKKSQDSHAIFESIHRRKDGALVDVEINVSGVELDGRKCFFALSRDITQRKQTENALRTSEQRFRDVSDAAGEYLWEVDANLVYTYVSNRSADVKGYHPEELLGHTPMEFMPEEDIATVGNIFNRAIFSKAPFKLQHRDFTKSGAVLWEEVSGMPFYDENGTVIGLRGAGMNITERKQAEIALSESEERLRATIETSMDAVVQINADGAITGWNSQTQEIFGWSRSEAVGRMIHETIIPPMHREAHLQGLKHFLLTGNGPILNSRIETVGLHRDGHELPIELTIAPIKMGGKFEFSAFIRDITRRKEQDEIIWRQANFDALTGLPNRQMFFDRIEQEIKKSKRTNVKTALLFIDLDRFKEINDTLGHDMGDLLLKEAASRINECVRTTDIVARFGGDEFVILLSEIDDIYIVERIVQNILQKLATSFMLKNETSYVSASIGISLYPNDAENKEDLLKNADQAMYLAKSQGRNRHSYFTRSLEEAAQAKLRLINDLRVALALNQLMVYFQPIVNMATGRIEKAEALVRWNHPVRGMVSPAEFIPLAEETGLIFEIGDWVFIESMRWVKRWRTQYNPKLQISVNKSPVQFYKDGEEHSEWLTQFNKLDLPGNCLVIEITEGLLMDSNALVTGALLTFSNCGIQVSIDDFGTGYSSLSYLKKFDIDYLKIDQTFTRGLLPGSSDLALSEAIIVMAHKLGIMVVAEGVENEQQKDMLAAAGCDYAQGYFFSAPIPAKEFEELLKS